MKKFLLLVPGMLLPYLLLAILFCLFFTVLPTNIMDIPAGFVLIAVIIVYGAVALFLNALFALLCVARKWDGTQIAKLNMIVKLAQIPAYITIFILGIFCFFTILTFMLSVFFVLFDGFSIFLSGLTGACAAFRKYSESKERLFQWFILGALQFVFVADVITCVALYVTAKRSSAAVE